MERKQLDKPLNTTITKKEYSIQQRSREIKDFLKVKKNIEFSELFEEFNRGYIVVTFLSVLDLAKKNDLIIKQENNFQKIYLSTRESD